MSKHLSLSERAIIEKMLNMDFTFAQIAKKLDRTPSTISREIKKHRVFAGQSNISSRCDCIYFFSCVKNTLCSNSKTCFSRCKLPMRKKMKGDWPDKELYFNCEFCGDRFVIEDKKQSREQ